MAEDNPIDVMKEMISQLKRINEDAYKQYKPVVSDLCSRTAPLDEVAHVLDRMLDFCGDDAFLGLFREVCRHYFKVYPEMIAYQINSYREIWDTE